MSPREYEETCTPPLVIDELTCPKHDKCQLNWESCAYTYKLVYNQSNQISQPSIHFDRQMR